MAKRTSSLALLLLLLTVGTAVATMSGTYYIKKGVTMADTFPSFVAAGNALQTQGGLSGNVTFLAFAGTYDEGICYLQNYAGDSTYSVTFDKAPGQGEVIVGGTSVSYCFYIYYTNNVKIKNLTLRPSSYGIYDYYSSNTKLQGCKIMSGSYGAMMYYASYDSVVGCTFGSTSVGIYFYGTSSPISKHNHASNNFCWGPTSYFIYSYYNDSLELYDNTIVGSPSYGIYAYYGTRWQMRGNIFKMPTSYCYYFSTGCTLDLNHMTVRRNDLYPSSSVAYYNSTTYSTLAAWQATGYDSLSISADPICGGGWNPHLKAGSPCINAGDTISGITTDFDGDSRTSNWPDIGADEYTGPPTGMSGTYTIKKDGTGNYKTFFDAMYDIWGKGFAGDITLEVYAGTYNEQIRLVDLYNGSYFLNIKAHTASGVTDRVVINAATSYDAYLTQVSKVKFTDLIFSGYTSYGAYCQTLTSGSAAYKGNDTITFRRCVFNGVNPIYLYYSCNYDSVVDCQLYAGSSYGIYTYASAAYPSGPNVFINNFIVGFTSYGIYSYYNSGNLYYYNTIYSPSCNYDVYEYYYNQTAPTFRNNIFYNGNTTTSYYAMYLYGSSTPPTSCLNYNCYWYPSGTYIAYVNSAKTWATLRSGGYEANGINRDPKVGSVVNPHLQDGSPCIDSATNISGITRDIDQELRDSAPGPGKYDMGADEHTFNWGGPMSGVYTIKQAGGGDFTSVTQAVYALAVRGFAGAVQFDVYNGTYTGSVNLYGLANGTNWLTFRVYPGQSATLDAGGDAYNFYMLRNKRVRITGFRMTGSTTYGIYMYGVTSVSPYDGCDTCSISYDTIIGPSSGTYYGIYSYYSDDDTLTYNVITGGTYGMYIYGYSTVGSYTKRNFLTYNTISAFTSYGIYTYYQDSMRIKGNIINGPNPIMSYYGSYDTLANNTLTATSSYGLYLYGYSSAPYSHCNIVANNTFSGGSYGMYTYYEDSMRIKNNSFTGGSYSIMTYYGSYDSILSNTTTGSSYGVYAYGYTSSPYSRCNVIANNNFTTSSYGVYSYYEDTLRIKNNIFNNGSGIYSNYGSYDSILNNTINATSSYGIYLYGYTTSPYGVNNVVANNLIRGYTSYGLYLYYQTNPQIVFNTFRGSASSSYGVYASYDFSWKLNDNIFQANSYALYNYVAATGDTYPTTTNNNDYFLNGGGSGVIYHSPIGAMTLAAWQALSLRDTNSINADPQYVSATDAHIGVMSPCINAGRAYAPFTTDIDGDSRTKNTPDIGADEVLVDMAARSILQPTGTHANYDTIVPSVAFKHVAGRGSATYYVYMAIARNGTQVYLDSAQRTTNPGDSATINFTAFVPTVADSHYSAKSYHKLICDTVASNDTARSNFIIVPVDVGVYGILAPVGTLWRNWPLNPKAILRNNGLLPATFNAEFTINLDSASMLSNAPSGQPAGQNSAPASGAVAPVGSVPSQGLAAQTNVGSQVGRTQSRGLVAQGSVGAAVGMGLSQGPTAQNGASKGIGSTSGQSTTRNSGSGAPLAGTPGRGSTGLTGTNSQTGKVPGLKTASPESFVYDTIQSVTLAAGQTETLAYLKSWNPTVDGYYTGACRVTKGGDYDSTNNYVQKSFNVQHLDIGVSALLSPKDTIIEDTVIAPSFKLRNYGTADANFSVRCLIKSGATTAYDTTETSIHLAPHDSVTRVFAKTWEADPLGDYTVTAYTMNAMDDDSTNDTAHATGAVVSIDLSATAMVKPNGHIAQDTTVYPTVMLKNNGRSPATFSLRCIITSGTATDYDTTETGIVLGAGDTVTHVFTEAWDASPVGPYKVVAYTIHNYDRNPVNDTAHGSGIVSSSAPSGWAEMTPLPKGPSGKPIKDGGCLTYDGSTDLIYASKGNKSGDFYSYNVATGTWVTLAEEPYGAEGKMPYKGSALCTDGNGKLYLTKGNNTVGFYQYVAATDTWIQMANVPYGSSGKKVREGAALAWGMKKDVGYVYLLKGYRNEFYKFNPANDSWTTLLNAPAGPGYHLKYNAGSWMVPDPDPTNHVLYVFKAQYHEMYEFNTDADTWLTNVKIHPMPVPGPEGAKKAKDGSCATTSEDGAIYTLKGGNTTEFWRYYTQGDSWQAMPSIPTIGNTGSRRRVSAGGALTHYPYTGMFAFKGNRTNEFWRFRPFWGMPAPREPNRDGVAAGTFDIANPSFAIAPNPLMGGLATVRYNLPKAGLATLSVFDVTGRTVFEQTMAAGRSGTANLDLRKLDAGVYLVKVATDGFSTTQKLIIEH
ncbi:MAG TPA: right-handed parallel beta-helix repeat-containing protein [bacterium]|nr:right-handed parallel beta-helix repeat-containing protein [bacterium]